MNGVPSSWVPSGFVSGPSGSQGNLCLGSPLARLTTLVQHSGVSGSIATRVQLTGIPGLGTVLADSTWNFQAFFRDRNPAPTSNFTDAISQIMSDIGEGEVPRILITGSLYLVGEVLKENS